MFFCFELFDFCWLMLNFPIQLWSCCIVTLVLILCLTSHVSFSRFDDILAIMRFKKGNKVEVLSRNGVPSGSWRCAEIVCGNGRYYTVRYDGYGGADDVLLEKLSRKAIRPCPPLPDVAEKFGLGDVIEVFDDFSWKMATISKVLGKDYFMVRLLGSCMEFEVSKFDIRVRQSWQDEKWVVIGKVFAIELNYSHIFLKYYFCSLFNWVVLHILLIVELTSLCFVKLWLICRVCTHVVMVLVGSKFTETKLILS